MIQAGVSGLSSGWAGVPYAPARLYTTIVVMLVAVTLAVLVVRARVANRLLAEIARTLGIFLVVIGTIVYTVAFRGLRPWELAFAWALSVPAIIWFVAQLNRIMMRPLQELEHLGDAIRERNWSALLAGSGQGRPCRRGTCMVRCGMSWR